MTEEDVVLELRQGLKNAGNIREMRMFGGTGFMLNGNMVAGTFRQGLLLRVGKERLAQALKLKGTQQMQMGGRLMEGYAYIEPEALNKKVSKPDCHWPSPLSPPCRRKPRRKHPHARSDEKMSWQRCRQDIEAGVVNPPYNR